MAEPAQTRLWNLVLRYLGYRARSEKEVRDFLRRKIGVTPEKGVTPFMIAKVLRRLKNLHLLDDSALAEAMVAEGQRQLKGRRRIFLDLKKKGLEIPTSVGSLNSSQPSSEEDLARAAAAKRARFYQNLDPQTFRRRLAGYLARRGFEWEVIKPVIDSFCLKR